MNPYDHDSDSQNLVIRNSRMKRSFSLSDASLEVSNKMSRISQNSKQNSQFTVFTVTPSQTSQNANTRSFKSIVELAANPSSSVECATNPSSFLRRVENMANDSPNTLFVKQMKHVTRIYNKEISLDDSNISIKNISNNIKEHVLNKPILNFSISNHITIISDDSILNTLSNISNNNSLNGMHIFNSNCCLFNIDNDNNTVTINSHAKDINDEYRSIFYSSLLYYSYPSNEKEFLYPHYIFALRCLYFQLKNNFIKMFYCVFDKMVFFFYYVNDDNRHHENDNNNDDIRIIISNTTNHFRIILKHHNVNFHIYSKHANEIFDIFVNDLYSTHVIYDLLINYSTVNPNDSSILLLSYKSFLNGTLTKLHHNVSYHSNVNNIEYIIDIKGHILPLNLLSIYNLLLSMQCKSFLVYYNNKNYNLSYDNSLIPFSSIVNKRYYLFDILNPSCIIKKVSYNNSSFVITI